MTSTFASALLPGDDRVTPFVDCEGQRGAAARTDRDQAAPAAGGTSPEDCLHPATAPGRDRLGSPAGRDGRIDRVLARQ